MSALVIKFWKAAVSIIGAAVFVGLSIAKESGAIGAFLIILGIAIQQALYLCKGIIDPSLAVSIVMESAVPMSKIDAAELFGTA